MRLRYTFPAIVGLGLALLAATPAPAETADAKKITQLIEQMGSSSFEERQKASDALDAVGEPALEALRKATKSTDAEVRKRATDLVSRIEARVESGKHLAANRGDVVIVWDLETGRELSRVSSDWAGGTFLAFAQGGKTLALVGHTGGVETWWFLDRAAAP